ncbi:TonB-dependent receptor [Muribaculum sp.]|uniref:TonB-dependent receptor n=1 Tax=Muribaculum sp. TaxID=1918611 RepID=UPI00257BC84A|nr:TonB-dependent receptor [Muribaculum sp.]
MTRFILMAALTIMSATSAVCNNNLRHHISSLPSDTNITGHVVDAATGEHLSYYNIRLAGTTTGTTTDASGHYALRNLKPGKYILEASSIGYRSQQKNISIEQGKTYEINFNVEPDAFMLDQVVVTGSKSEQKRRNSPVLVGVLNNQLFNLVSARSLADGLNFQPGVRVENDCQNCGFTQVRINGLDGHYSQILMNSRPVFSALTGVYGLEQIPANMIERVEIMRGGGSALFGSSAIGGTVNIITKDPVANYAEAGHSIMSTGISGSLDNNTTVNASITGANNRAGLMIYGQNRNRDGYDHNGDGFTEIATLKSQTLGIRAFMRPDNNSRLSIEYHGTHEYRRGGDNLDLPPHQAWIAEEVEHDIHGGELSFDLWSKNRISHLNTFVAAQNTRRKSYYGSELDPDAYGRTHDLVVTAGAQYTHNFTRLMFMPAEFIAGIEYNHNYLNDVTIGYDHRLSQRVNIYSGYLQNEWRNERWGFLIGSRIDKHSMINRPILSPRANIRFNPSEKLNLRLSYSTGFRSPQAYDEDLHIAIVGGERVVTVLAPGLKQESSNSLSASADFYQRFGNIQANFMIEAFYTDLRDVFALRKLQLPDAAGNTVLERYNGGGATVGGLNLEAKAIFSPRLQVQLGATWQQSRYKQPEHWSENPDIPPVRRMFRTPDVYGYITATYKPIRNLSIAFSGTYTGSMLVQHMEGSGTPVDKTIKSPQFFDAGIKVSYEIKVFNTCCIEPSIGITNLFNSYQDDFDSGYLRDSGYIYGPSTPRSLTASVKVHL